MRVLFVFKWDFRILFPLESGGTLLERDNPSTRKRGFSPSKPSTFPSTAWGYRPKTRRSAMRCLPSFVLLAPLAFLYASLPKTVKTRSHYSSTQFGKMPSEASDAPTQIGKMQIEASDVSAQFGKVPSEVSDAPTQFWKVPSETSDTSAQFGNKPSEPSDTSARHCAVKIQRIKTTGAYAAATFHTTGDSL